VGLATAKTLHILRGHQDTAHGLAFTPDGKSLVSGGARDDLRLWDTETGTELRRIPLHDAGLGEKNQNVMNLQVPRMAAPWSYWDIDPNGKRDNKGI